MEAKEATINSIAMNNGGIIITFDVGGQIYRVSKDLLLKFPDTMICMAASDLDTSNRNDPIFVERNGHRFQYVLDYMRDDTLVSLYSLSKVEQEEFYREMEYYGFRCHNDIYYPKDVKYIDGIVYHHIKWDVTCAAPGLFFECKNHVVKVDSSQNYGKWKCVMGTVGFTTGTHFWNVEIVKASKNYVMIGVSDKLVITEPNAPGHKLIIGSTSDEIGACYSGIGNRHYGGTTDSFGPCFSKGDVIGTLLNLNKKTVTFYKNGIRIGTAVNSGSLTGTEYYPCVAIMYRGTEVRCVGYNNVFKHN